MIFLRRWLLLLSLVAAHVMGLALVSNTESVGWWPAWVVAICALAWSVGVWLRGRRAKLDTAIDAFDLVCVLSPMFVPYLCALLRLILIQWCKLDLARLAPERLL